MPRDINGNYTLPAGNPVAPDTIISTLWANPTMEDIGQEITESLDRNGRGGMKAPFLNLDGDVISPGISWVQEPGSGFYRNGVADMRVSINGDDAMIWTGSAVTILNDLRILSNVVISGNAPLFTMNADAGTNSEIFIETDGVGKWRIGGVTANADLRFRNETTGIETIRLRGSDDRVSMAGDLLIANGSLTIGATTGGGVTGASIDNNGQLIRTP